jgi:cellulose synthase/poly-beta-1,6-N-acetylglucosamine synthase-like glycosyltransferase/spore germination protein YaaH/peptidoglycan/xylan/chitin deacetylase (PgdA/CDA1 family)
MNRESLYQQDEEREQIGAPGTLVKTSFALSDESSAELSVQPNVEQPAQRTTKPPVIFGFHAPWDENSFRAVKAHPSSLTHVLAEWLILDNGNGDLRDATEMNVVEWSRQAHVPILSVLTNYRDDKWRSEDIHKILTHPYQRTRLVANVVASVKKYKLAGVNLDIEQAPVKDRDSLTAFVRELHEALKPLGLLLTQDVPTDDANVAAYDMVELSKLNDYVIPMVYDERYATGAPGPVASLRWVRAQLQTILKQLPPEKAVVGLGNYGYDWTLGSNRAGVELGFTDVLSRANQYHGRLEWHAELMNPSLRYSKAGVDHEVWFLDAVTALNAIREVQRSGFAGFSFWRLGAEDPGLWTVLKNRRWPADTFSPNELTPIDAIDGVRQYGRGEAIWITQTRSPGRRHVWRDGVYARETFEQIPTGDVVGGIGAPDHKLITLTFDDGPDPRYTPRILDILKVKHISATFFVIGRQAKECSILLRRMYAEGHNIGNHTYSHLNEGAASDLRLSIELNLTQRVVEYSTGHSTTMFRSPYIADSDPRTLMAVQSVLRPQRLGYLTIGERIDPRDWEHKTAEEIVANVERDRPLGNVILLHDGGGEREATVAALPVIIDRLRAQGNQIVALQDLLGVKRADLMPPSNSGERWWSLVEGGLLRASAFAVLTFRYLFWAAIGLTLLRTVLYAVLGTTQKLRSSRRRFDPEFYPPVSVIIAAHNEAKVIANTVNAALASDYPDFEIIVTDDGSTDSTLKVLNAEFLMEPRVRILTHENRGKAASLNRMVEETQHEILVALDADTLFLPDTIGKLVRHFSDSRVAAVSGNARVGNRMNWITRFQSIEYVCGFNLDRRALDLLNAVTVVPGAVGAWRKSSIIEAGGYPNDTVAEDADLTLAIRRKGYLIRYEDRAIAFTEAPETVPALVSQRLRWAFGTLQSAWKHRDTTLRAGYGSMGFVTMPSIWLNNFLLATISPLAEVALFVALATGQLRAVALYYTAFLAAEFVSALLAYILEAENPALLVWLPFQRLLYPHLMLYVVSKSILFALGGRALSWGVQVRNATVRIHPEFLDAVCAESD